ISRNVNKATTDLSAAVHEYQNLASDARQTLRAMKLEAVGTDTDRLVNRLDGQLQILIAKLNAIDVPALNDTLAGTREAARNLNEALEALKTHPSGFLFGAAPAPMSGLLKGDK